MFGNISCSAAIFAAECQTLQHAQNDQDCRCDDTKCCRSGQNTDEKRRCAHDNDGHEEGIFTTDEIADASEDERAERAHEKACCESEQDEDITGSFRIFIKERRANKGSQCSIEIKVVPFKYCAE